MADRNGHIQQLQHLIDDIRIAMLTTEDAYGGLHSRPMATQQLEFDGDLWFFTRASSGKAKEVRDHWKVNVSYAAPDKSRFVSVSGTARLVRDAAKVKQLWSPAYKVWFPEGQDDPDLTLLKVTVESAEYWDAPSGKMVQMAGFVKAIVSGKGYHASEGEHGTIQFS